VSALNGEITAIQANDTWLIMDVRSVIRDARGINSDRLRLFTTDAIELIDDSMPLTHLCQSMDSLDLTLIVDAKPQWQINWDQHWQEITPPQLQLYGREVIEHFGDGVFRFYYGTYAWIPRVRESLSSRGSETPIPAQICSEKHGLFDFPRLGSAGLMKQSRCRELGKRHLHPAPTAPVNAVKRACRAFMLKRAGYNSAELKRAGYRKADICISRRALASCVRRSRAGVWRVHCRRSQRSREAQNGQSFRRQLEHVIGASCADPAQGRLVQKLLRLPRRARTALLTRMESSTSQKDCRFLMRRAEEKVDVLIRNNRRHSQLRCKGQRRTTHRSGYGKSFSSWDLNDFILR